MNWQLEAAASAETEYIHCIGSLTNIKNRTQYRGFSQHQKCCKSTGKSSGQLTFLSRCISECVQNSLVYLLRFGPFIQISQISQISLLNFKICFIVMSLWKTFSFRISDIPCPDSYGVHTIAITATTYSQGCFAFQFWWYRYQFTPSRNKTLIST